MQHRSVASDILTRTNPAIFSQPLKRHHHIDVIHNAGGRDGLRWNTHNQIRLTEGPFCFRPGHLCQRIFHTIHLGTLCYPVQEGLLILYGNRVAVHKISNVRIYLPRWHPFGHQYFTNHRRPALRHGMAVQCKRCDSAFAVAGSAVLDQNRRYFLAVGNPTSQILLAPRVTDHVSGKCNLRSTDCLPGIQLSQRLLQPTDRTPVHQTEAARIINHRLTC